MSQKEINNYFQNHWYPNQKPDRFEQYEYSGNAILDKIIHHRQIQSFPPWNKIQKILILLC